MVAFCDLGNDTIYGQAGRDYLQGNDGDDRLYGGIGDDVLTGGTGVDHFIYTAATDSDATNGIDVINDFSQAQGDKINLSALTGGSGTVTAGTSFSGIVNEVLYSTSGSNTDVQVDLNGDGAADMSIQLVGTLTLSATDFIF